MDLYNNWGKKKILNTKEATFFSMDLSTCLHIMKRENGVFTGEDYARHSGN